ncbi:MAG: hypothetical protein C5B53_10515, partial [Candidatus Melainabacteria bacterium]
QPKPSVSSTTTSEPVQISPVVTGRSTGPIQRIPAARMKPSAPPLMQSPSQMVEPVPLESLQQPIPLEPAVTSITKENVEKTAAMGAVGGIAVYDALEPEQRQRAKDAAMSGLSKGWKKWQSLDDNQKASAKRTAVGAVGKAIKLWKQLPER